jgi:hypothetical protein
MRETEYYSGSTEEVGLEGGMEINDDILFSVRDEIDRIPSSADPEILENIEGIYSEAEKSFDKDPVLWNEILTSLSQEINDGDLDEDRIAALYYRAKPGAN